MRYLIIFTLLYATFLKAQEEEFESILYKNQNISTIHWDDVREDTWLDLTSWKRELEWREKVGNWKLYYQEIKLVEPVGHLLECIGTCTVHRGVQKEEFSPVFRSKLFERDEFETSDSSYAYIYMLDGTMLRLSPNTSISINEFNINPAGSFLYIRVNYGQILSIPRVQQEFTPRKLRETDIIFYPLSFYQAHLDVMEKGPFSEDKLYNYTLLKKRYEKKYNHLNELIGKNKIEFPTYKSTVLFATANGNFLASNSVLDLIVLENAEAYVRHRTGEGVYYDQSPEQSEALFYSREEKGVTATESLTTNQWYTIDIETSSLAEYPEGNRKFYMPSLVTKRMPSIFIARELFMQQYSKFLFEKELTKRTLAVDYSFRLWDKWDSDGDSDKRLNFLIAYSRKIEAKNHYEKKKLFKILESREEKAYVGNYDESYYSDALRLYLFSQKKRSRTFDLKTGILNSTRKHYWKIITKQYD